jgi:hypothetical protein
MKFSTQLSLGAIFSLLGIPLLGLDLIFILIPLNASIGAMICKLLEHINERIE